MASSDAQLIALAGDLVTMGAGFVKPTTLEVQQSSQIYKDMVRAQALDRSIADEKMKALTTDIDKLTNDDLEARIVKFEELEKDEENSIYENEMYALHKQKILTEQKYRNDKVSTVQGIREMLTDLEANAKKGIGDYDQTVSMLDLSEDIKNLATNIANATDSKMITDQTTLSNITKRAVNIADYQATMDKLGVFDADRENDVFDMPGISVNQQGPGAIDEITQDKILQAINLLEAKDYKNANIAAGDAITSSDELIKTRRTASLNQIAGLTDQLRQGYNQFIGEIEHLSKIPGEEVRTEADKNLMTAASRILSYDATKTDFNYPDFRDAVKESGYDIVSEVERHDKGFRSGDVLEQSEQLILNDEGKRLYLGGRIYHDGAQWIYSDVSKTIYQNSSGETVNPYGSFGHVSWDQEKIDSNINDVLLPRFTGTGANYEIQNVKMISKITQLDLDTSDGFLRELKASKTRKTGATIAESTTKFAFFENAFENVGFKDALVNNPSLIDDIAKFIRSADENDKDRLETSFLQTLEDLVMNKKISEDEMEQIVEEYTKLF